MTKASVKIAPKILTGELRRLRRELHFIILQHTVPVTNSFAPVIACVKTLKFTYNSGRKLFSVIWISDKLLLADKKKTGMVLQTFVALWVSFLHI